MAMTTATTAAQPAASANLAARPARAEARQPKPLPAPNSDFYQLVDVLTPEEIAIVKKVRAYMESKVQRVAKCIGGSTAFPDG